MSEWKEIEINEIIDTVNTGLDAIKRAPIVEHNTGIKCLRIQDVSQDKEYLDWGFTEVEEKNYDKFQLKKNDIIIARTGATVGVNKFIDSDIKSVFNNGLIRIRTKQEKCLPKLLYYNFRTDNFKSFIESISGGTSSQPNIQINGLLSYDISLPPLPKQKAIAEVLSSLDDKIDLLHRQNKTLEQMAETLFRQWFMEEAKKDWEERPLSSIANFLNGLACQKYPPKNEAEKLPVLKIKQLRNGFSDDCDWATTEVKPEYIVENGDVIFSWSASLMVKIWDGETCILNQHLFKVTSNDFPKWYYYLWSKHHLDRFIAIAKTQATTMGHIKRGDLDNAVVLVPTDDEMIVFSEIQTPIIDKIIANNRQLKKLVAIRDTLLPKLVNGEVKVSIDG